LVEGTATEHLLSTWRGGGGKLPHLGGPAMPRVVFTANIQRHVKCPPTDVGGDTVREALDAVFAGNQRARGYVLDEHGALRKHMIIFVDGEMIRDRDRLSDPVPTAGEIYVMQSLSGG
jgi:hypothetical protein